MEPPFPGFNDYGPTLNLPLRESLRQPGPVRFEVVADRQGAARDQAHRPHIRVRGELDVLTAPRLAAHLDSVVRQPGGDVVLDLHEVDFIDSAGLQLLLSAQRRLMRRSRRLSVVCGPGPVRSVIELARLGATLRVTEPARA